MKGALFCGFVSCLSISFSAAATTLGQDTLQDAAKDTPRHACIERLGDSVHANLNTRLTPKPLRWKAVAIPAALVTYGVISVTTGLLDDVNLLGKKWASANEDPNSKTRVDDFTEFAPPVAVLGLQLGGLRGKNNLIDETFIYAMSWGLAHAITGPLKILSRETRPDSSDTRSFPSGHTTTAFLGAEFLRQEYKDVSPWIGAGGYAAAILTGYLRMYNNKHWFSDVLAGAGIGILSTRVSYWLYPKVKNIVLNRTTGGRAMILPTYGNGRFGICASYQFR